MTYTYNDQAIFEAVPGAKAIIRRPIGMPGFRWKTYAAGVVLALNSNSSTSALELGEAIHKAMLDGDKESPSMKLVDILALEIKVWPKGCQYISHDQSVGVFASLEGGGNIKLKVGDHYIADTPKQVVTRAEWQAAVDALKAPKVDIADGNVRLGVLIEMGYLKPVRFETPSYDFSAWPPERFDCGLLPSLYVQSFGRSKRHQPVEPKPKSTAQENTEFLQARVKLLEAELEERREEAKAGVSLIVDDAALVSMSLGFSVFLIVDGRKVTLIRDKS